MDSKSKRISLARPWVKLTIGLVMLTTTTVSGFQGLQKPMGRRHTTTRQMAAMDPNDLMHLAHHHHPTWDAILSTLYSAENLKPAHGHTQPWFGPPDPLLTYPLKSIPPHWKELGFDEIPKISSPLKEWPYKLFEASRMEDGKFGVLPGFKPTGGILPRHQEGFPTVITEKVLGNQVQFVEKSFGAYSKLPMAAAVYAVIDFAILRRDVDLYKEDIEEEPLEVAAETMAATGVRLGVFFLIALVTVTIFG